MLTNYNLRTWSEIDLDAIESNYALLSSLLPERTLKLAVVKADAYGHGAVQIAKLLADRADYFGVARADEAVELRRAGIQNTKILILGHTAPYHYSVLFKHDLIPTIFSLDEADKLNCAAREYGQKLNIHIAVNTGMNRIGFEPDDAAVETIKKIYSFEYLTVDGIFSHFADADNGCDDSFTQMQLSVFRDFCRKLDYAGVKIPVRHIFNSAAIAEIVPEFEMVREGICLYGLPPSDELMRGALTSLKPAMSLRSEVTHIHKIKAGDSVSYGLRFTAGREMTVATVCAGYADGVPRASFKEGFVLINGKRAKILGTVCMDQLMCDISDIEGVYPGSVVTVFGKDGDESIGASDVARWAGTISYEIICGISKRVPRVYIKDGEVSSIHYGIPHEEF
ncbi:MAG: alanine racemase [Clostridia bacterium]|nr:alanine racemase [Clostridia bacterium]